MATLSRQQIIQNINAMEAQGADPKDIQAYIDSLGTSTPQTTPSPKKTTASFSKSIVAPALGVVSGFAQLGRPLQNIAGKTLNKLTGTGFFPEVTRESAEATARDVLGVDTESKQFRGGRFAGETLPFVMGGNAVTSAVGPTGPFSRLLARSVGQAGAAATVDVAQEGKVGVDTLVTAALAGASVPIGDALSLLARGVTTKLPEWFVRPLTKQTKTAKEQGKDIVPFMVEKGRVGNIESLVNQSDESMSALNSKINSTLKASSKKINLYQVAQEVADDLNKKGAATSADEILASVRKQAFQSRGVIEKAMTNQLDDAAISAANKLRSQLDETLYSGKDYLRQSLPENKAILEAYTNTLRNRVQQLAPSTKPLFKDFSKEITLKNALISAQSSSAGRNSLSALDVIAGGAVGVGTGSLPAGLAAFAGRRAFESPAVKTSLAKVFSSQYSKRAIDALIKASPAGRSAIINFIDDLLSKQKSQSQ